MTGYERDRHQEDKDNRAQGYDREPDPPEDPPPLDLDEVARHYHEALGEDMRGIPEHCKEALAAVPELLARLRAAEEEVERLHGLPRAYQYAVTDGKPPTWHTASVSRQEAEAAWQEAGRTPWLQVRITDPWAELEEPPF